MSRIREKTETYAKKAGVQRPGSSVCVIAAFLVKLAKHMALLACIMIVGSVTGRATINEVAIFLLIASATVVYSIGRSLERRSPEPARLPVRGP